MSPVRERVARQLDQLCPAVVLCPEDVVPFYAQLHSNVRALPAARNLPAADLDAAASDPNATVLIQFTSGSTGEPRLPADGQVLDSHTAPLVGTTSDLCVGGERPVSRPQAMRGAVTVLPSTLSFPVPSAFLEPVQVWCTPERSTFASKRSERPLLMRHTSSGSPAWVYQRGVPNGVLHLKHRKRERYTSLQNLEGPGQPL